MKYTQFLIFEIGRECSLAKEHSGKCPSGDPDRYGLLPTSTPTSDQQIMDSVQWAYSAGFHGYIGWHYYNEALLFWGRMKPLMEKIKEAIPSAEFVLWTSGVRIGRNIQPQELSVFSQVWVTDYHKRTAEWKALRQHVSDVKILNGVLDGRRRFSDRTHNPHCLRPFNEFIVDYYGNGHLCCADWHGDVHIGSIHTDGYPSMFERFVRIREALARTEGHPAAPSLCRICRLNSSGVWSLVPRVFETITKEGGFCPRPDGVVPPHEPGVFTRQV